MRRELLTIFGITALVVVAVFVAGPWLSSLSVGTSTRANSIPLPPVESRPLVAPKRGADALRQVHVTLTAQDSMSGLGVPFTLHFSWLDRSGVPKHSGERESDLVGRLNAFVTLPTHEITAHVTADTRNYVRYEHLTLSLACPGEETDLGAVELIPKPQLMIVDPDGLWISPHNVFLFRLENGQLASSRGFEQQGMEISNGDWIAVIQPQWDSLCGREFAWFIEFKAGPGKNKLVLPRPDPATLRAAEIELRTSSEIEPDSFEYRLELLGPFGLSTHIEYGTCSRNRLETRPLRPGAYRISVRPDYDNQWTTTEFSVGDQALPEPIILAVREPAALKISVTRSGVPVSGIRLKLLSWNEPAYEVRDNEGVPTNQDGAACFGKLEPGIWFVAGIGPWFRLPSVSVIPGEIRELNIDLEQSQGATVRVNFNVEPGQCSPRTIELWPDQQEDASVSMALDGGRFVVQNVPSGVYHFRARLEGGGRVYQPEYSFTVEDNREHSFAFEFRLFHLNASAPLVETVSESECWLLREGDETYWKRAGVFQASERLDWFLPAGRYALVCRAGERLFLGRADIRDGDCPDVFWHEYVGDEFWPRDIPLPPQ